MWEIHQMEHPWPGSPRKHRVRLTSLELAPPRLGTAIESERGRLFVGRVAELTHLHTWLDDAAGTTRVLALSGMGGIGKSALLAEMLRLAGGRRTITFWVDGRACGRSPAGVLDYL